MCPTPTGSGPSGLDDHAGSRVHGGQGHVGGHDGPRVHNLCTPWLLHNSVIVKEGHQPPTRDGVVQHLRTHTRVRKQLLSGSEYRPLTWSDKQAMDSTILHSGCVLSMERGRAMGLVGTGTRCVHTAHLQAGSRGRASGHGNTEGLGVLS